MRSNMRLSRGCNRFSRSQHRLTADSQYFSREEMISVPWLCAYIPAIYANFPGIFNRLIRLDFLTRRVIDRIWTYSLRHEPCMRRPHVPPVIRTCDDRSDLKRHSRCLVSMRLRLNSDMRGTNRNEARHHPAVPNRAERIAFVVSTIPDPSATSIFKRLPY